MLRVFRFLGVSVGIISLSCASAIAGQGGTSSGGPAFPVKIERHPCRWVEGKWDQAHGSCLVGEKRKVEVPTADVIRMFGLVLEQQGQWAIYEAHGTPHLLKSQEGFLRLNVSPKWETGVGDARAVSPLYCWQLGGDVVEAGTTRPLPVQQDPIASDDARFRGKHLLCRFPDRSAMEVDALYLGPKGTDEPAEKVLLRAAVRYFTASKR
jgi:hypothetical protein